MLNYNLDSVQSAERLIRLCEKYRDDIGLDIDIIHGRQTVDGCSLLGVTSLIGKFVSVVPVGRNEDVIKLFRDYEKKRESERKYQCESCVQKILKEA